MSNYIAITFGPITRVISLARTTRGMWAASYLFSYLAKQIIVAFKTRPFILPYMDDSFFSEKFNGAGVFPDRYIFESQSGDFDRLADKAEEAIKNMAGEIAPNDKDNASQMLKQYLKVYFFETSRGDNEDERIFVERCEKQLALLEQNDSLIPSIPQSERYLSQFINSKKLQPMEFLMKDADIGKFSSIVNISSGDDGYGKEELPVFPYQRYIAIVYADGDSMGKAFAQAASSSDLSRSLFEFNKKAIQAINEFEGQPVFIGGDDLFFFAPVYSPATRTSVFSLLNSLDQAFRSTTGDSCPATLSFGVSITYIKYPMSEAVRLSRELLSKAKGDNPPEKEDVLKNNVVFALQKHSGQTHEALLHKGCTKTVEAMNNLLNAYALVDDSKDQLLITSVMHNLRAHEPVLLNAITDKNLLTYYFANNYNEPVHTQFREFFADVSNFLFTAYSEFCGKTDRLKRSLPSHIEHRPKGHDAEFAAIDLCFATLQFIHLINAKNNE